VQRAWAGIRRQRTWTQQPAPEAGADQVRAMVAACPLDHFIGVRDRALLLLLHYVLGTRRSELAALDVEDLVLVDQGLVAIVWRRKTDQERRDLDLVAVPYLPQPATCPVRAWLAWQEAAGLTSGPAFRPVHPRARLDSPQAPAIRAQLQAAPRLRDEKVSLVLKRLAGLAGLADPDRYSSHSTRRGFAAELARHGASDLEIAAAGGWQRLDQVRRYAMSAASWHDPRPPGSGCSDGDRHRRRPAPRGARRPGPGAGPGGSGPAGPSSARPPWTSTLTGRKAANDLLAAGSWGRTPSRWAWPARRPL
jgi:integrase